MRLGGLDADAARRLLAERAGEALPEEVSDRLVRETGGNPLALLELPAGLTAGQLRGTAPLPRQLLLTAGVERAFLDRCRRLPEPVQTLLLVAAADDTGRLATVQRAVGHNLQPYLAAAGHIVIMRADGQTFAHEHADVRDSSGAPVFALPGTTFGPDLPVHVHFEEAGTYRLWGQFRLASGRIITIPFTVEAFSNH